MKVAVGRVRARRARSVSPRARAARRSIPLSISILLGLGLAGCDSSPQVPVIKRDIFLLVVDTLRVDHLSLYGYERPTSPHLDRLAESAIVFEDVVATAPWTLPSVASVLTSLYPGVHGVRASAHAEGMTALRPEVETLAEVLAREGYRTAAIQTNPWLVDDAHGIARGFEEVVRLGMANAPRVNELAREVVARDDPRPLFLYLHYMDPHGPFDRHPDFDPAVLGPIPEALDRPLTKQEIRSLPKYIRLLGKTDLGSYIQAYDRAIRAWDESFGEWIEWLDARTERPPALVTVVANHGEEFTDHGGWNHGETLYEEQLSVPWVLRLPGREPLRVSDRVVSLIDVAPTILRAVGVPVPAVMTGLDALGDWPQPDRPVFAETETRIGGIPDPRFLRRAVRRENTKQIQTPLGSECYDLASDSGERSPACDDSSWPKRAAEDIEHWIRESKELADTLGTAKSVELDPEQQERLRAIGYLE